MCEFGRPARLNLAHKDSRASRLHYGNGALAPSLGQICTSVSFLLHGHQHALLQRRTRVPWLLVIPSIDMYGAAPLIFDFMSHNPYHATKRLPVIPFTDFVISCISSEYSLSSPLSMLPLRPIGSSKVVGEILADLAQAVTITALILQKDWFS